MASTLGHSPSIISSRTPIPSILHRADACAPALSHQPAEIDVDTWFEALDRFEDPFMPEGREQPRAPARDVFG